MSATAEDVERYINEMTGWGARVSTVKVAATAKVFEGLPLAAESMVFPVHRQSQDRPSFTQNL